MFSTFEITIWTFLISESARKQTSWKVKIYKCNMVNAVKRLLSKKSKLVVWFFWTRLTHPDHQLPLHSGQVVLNVVEVVVVVVVLVFFRIWFGHGHGCSSILSPINQIVTNVQSYASSELFLRKLSQTSKKPVGQVEYFVNSKQGVFQIQCKISRNLKKMANLQALLDAMCTLVNYKPHLVPPCHLVVVYNNHPHCHFVTDFNQSILYHLV